MYLIVKYYITMEKNFELPATFQDTFSEEQHILLECILKKVSYLAGQTIFKQGQATQYIYILCTGQVDILHKLYDGPEMVISHISEGDVFGWSAVLKREIYTSSAVSLTECDLIRISAEKLSWLCEAHPNTGIIFLHHIANSLSTRLHGKRSDIFSMLKPIYTFVNHSI